MKKNCERFVEDIAALASDSAGFGTEAAAHLQHCEACRKKLAEMKAVASMHREAAAHMTEPKQRLSRSQLERALAKGEWRRRNFEIRWRPVLVGAMAFALIVGATVIHRAPRERADAQHQSQHQPRERKVAGEVFEPTMIALRYEVESEHEQMLRGTTGPGIRHYRVKDVESVLRN